MLSDTDNVIT